MPFSYSGRPSSSLLDQVRFLIGDTDAAEAKLADEEITFLLDEWGSPYEAAAAAADHLSATAASWMSYSADGQNLNLSELQEKYARMADALRASGRRRNRAAPYVGGIESGDVAAHEMDASVIHPDFGTGIHDNRREGGVSGGATRRDLLGGEW